MSNKYSRKLRLLTSKDFQQVYRAARRFTYHPYVILVKPNNLEYPRLGISLARKKVRTAVQRNWIKRSLRESFRAKQHELKGLDIIVIIKQNIPSKDLTFTKCLNESWERISCYYQKV